MTTALAVKLSLPETDDATHFVPLQIMLEALCKVNEYHSKRALRAGCPYPPLYSSGVRYRMDPPGSENWPDIPGVLANGFGCCKDLTAYRVGELRAAGVQCEPVLKWQWIPADVLKKLGYPKRHLPRDGVWLVHCLVRYADGVTVEDPSKILGMTGNFMEGI